LLNPTTASIGLSLGVASSSAWTLPVKTWSGRFVHCSSGLPAAHAGPTACVAIEVPVFMLHATAHVITALCSISGDNFPV